MAERVRLLAAGDSRSSLACARDQICCRKSVRLCRAKSSNSIVHAREFKSHLQAWRVEKMAERVRFELTCRNYPTIRFRVGAVMTASVPLRARNVQFFRTATFKLGPPRGGRVF